MRITGRDNPRIKHISKLISSAKARRESGLFVLEGARICTDAYESDIEIVTLVCSDNAELKYSDALNKLRRSCENELSVTNELFAKICDTKNPQGILCVCRMPRLRLTGDRVLSGGKYLALETLSDPANLGTIARTAEALGIDGIIMSADSCDPYGPKALRAGMGSLLRIPILVCDDFLQFICFAAQRMPVYAAVPRSDARSVSEMPLCNGGIVMIGNEGNGLSEQAINAAVPITIPMSGRAESLNAAAAAAIMMWEMCR